ncbi:MAG: OmpH family outer membrane protein [Planctomycetes bacterium]|nr:OmpH family outer membrane protein [Planctomycetota bacterium]
MKPRSLIFAAMAVALLISPLGAQEAGLKIGVVNIQRVFTEYVGVVEMQDKLEEDLKPDKAEIEKLMDETEKMIQDMRNDRMIEPGSFAWFDQDQKIQRNKFLMKTLRTDFNKLLDERRTVVFKAFYADFCLAIEQYAKNNQYDLIISVTDKELKGENSFDVLNEITLKTLHYYSPTLDRTDQIIAVMNRLYEQKKQGGN